MGRIDSGVKVSTANRMARCLKCITVQYPVLRLVRSCSLGVEEEEEDRSSFPVQSTGSHVIM